MKGKRLGAAIIDLIIILFTITLTSTITSLLIYRYNLYIIPILITSFLPLLLFFIYYTVIPYLTKGSTLGKLMVGIKVVTLDYKKPTFLRLFIRNIFFFQTLLFNVPIILSILHLRELTVVLSILIGLINFGITLVIFIMIISTEEERGLHDYIAKTSVVSKQFDIAKATQANALERSQMDWAIFDDTPTTQIHEDSNHNNSDHIEILNRND